ncbi:integrase catalytic domain-containing protein [Trichonephila clavipes]|nr:integrase catalytic domain-containing protein [Trichonephila clavipes]
MNLRSSQLMGDLPPIRFQQIRPFERFIDCCISSCFLRRFIARRSCPSKIISDNGSNFKGASSHLRKLVDLFLQEVQNFLSLKGIEWSFIPPYTPHFGGLWEALSRSPSDFTALTPAHYLVGGPIHQFPEPSQPSRSVGLSERWNLIQRLRQYFWDRWSTEYLHRLQPRSKWWRTKPNLQLGDMVIVEKEKTAPLNWTFRRINKLFFGPDQKVRVVSVNIKCGQLTRNVNKIYLLPNSQEYEL